ncbi:alpha/beta fold hydrolase [Myxococcus llanfairpwllgwyngyllgogerychwyrndrobwllllantysiliogogogochensis]|uniref:Alpha/beta fold hydrolase n=1 Tax=Myxococcus llanfairpwllgwyngyllgogerychwyrndrobwllllantysiliogogogochensis TaxID=2590453 RepID=A0A540X1B4_9BACT|nr:alpha/beta fold hydrolase [Myxococcus llanfairpwllgwyngyllgogerychwyrndrobwllllantysiliogogogochensis]TQF15000.1 alpha/beta fold hydrolase [Myxococcus llanfairpwllgwyngyllgogerychwyrndrobwllllantysiliogogogochensis]
MSMSHATALEQDTVPSVRSIPQEDRLTAVTQGTSPGVPFRLKAQDGYPLAATLFPHEGAEVGAVVLLAGATGARQRYYSRFASFLARRGFPTVTFDYRGIGGSRPDTLTSFGARMEDWGSQDLAGAIAAMRERFPGRRLLMVGHSVGGQLLGLAENAREVSALLNVATGSGYYKLFPQRLRMALNWRVLTPVLTRAFGKLPGWAGTAEDLPAGVAAQWARWCLSPDYLLSEGGEARREAFASLYLPLRAYSFSDDPIASKASVEHLLSFYADALVEHRRLTPKDVGQAIGHFGFFRENFRDTLWEDAVEWLAIQALTPRPVNPR